MYWCSGMFKVLTIDSDYLFDWFWLWKTWWTRMFLYKNLPKYLWIDEEEKVGHPKKRKKNQRRSNRPPHLRLTNLRSWLTYSLFPHNVWPLSSDLTWCFGIFHTGKGIFHISQRQIFFAKTSSDLRLQTWSVPQCGCIFGIKMNSFMKYSEPILLFYKSEPHQSMIYPKTSIW